MHAYQHLEDKVNRSIQKKRAGRNRTIEVTTAEAERFRPLLPREHEPGKTDQHVLVAEEFVMEGQPLLWSRLSPTFYEPFQRQCGGAQPFFVASTRPAN